jgi:HKD family nuclease
MKIFLFIIAFITTTAVSAQTSFLKDAAVKLDKALITKRYCYIKATVA